MVQGSIKKAKIPAKASKTKAPEPKRGRVIPPKNPTLVQKHKTEKKLTATINKNIESIMKTRAAGHLTILKPDKEKVEGSSKA